uniref:PAP-associated domain-containing protein n=1 Tax=Anopheles christyi TaxID=43041 RepID=A0A182JZN6_9DIPT
MGRTKVRKASFSNCPKITATLSSNASHKTGSFNLRMETEQSRPLFRLNGYRGNNGFSSDWSHLGSSNRSSEKYQPTDPHPLRSHLRYFGQQVFRSDGPNASNATAYKYTVDFLNDVRQHMYLSRNKKKYGERALESRISTESSYQANHTFANLLRCYGYHHNWLSFKFCYTYHKELIAKPKQRLWLPPGECNDSDNLPVRCDQHPTQESFGETLPPHSLENKMEELKITANFQNYNGHAEMTADCIATGARECTGSLINKHNSTTRALSPREHITLTPTATSPLLVSSGDSLSMDMWRMFHANRQSDATFAKKMRLWEMLYDCFRQMSSWLQKHELYLMGSTISGFGTDTSDMDMCIVDIDGPTYCDSRTEALNNLLRVKCFIESLPTCSFEHLDLIRAKVPILRFRHVEENIDIDLSINNCVGIRNTHLLNCYAQLDQRVRPMVLVIKLWAQHHNLNDPINSTMSSYSLVLMVINFLQCGVSPAVIPCLHRIFPEKFCMKNFTNNLLERIAPHRSDNMDTLGELLLKFFKYYAEFDYANYAISIRMGRILPLSECKWNAGDQSGIGIFNYLFIEEPFNRTNTGKSVYNKYVFEQIRSAFAASWKMLEEHQNLSILFQEPLFTPSLIPSPNSYF